MPRERGQRRRSRFFGSDRTALSVGGVMRLRKPVRWWEPVLPAGVWLYAAGAMLQMVRTLMRSGLFSRRGILIGMRLSARLSRAGFNSWRFWGGKWR